MNIQTYNMNRVLHEMFVQYLNTVGMEMSHETVVATAF